MSQARAIMCKAHASINACLYYRFTTIAWSKVVRGSKIGKIKANCEQSTQRTHFNKDQHKMSIVILFIEVKFSDIWTRKIYTFTWWSAIDIHLFSQFLIQLLATGTAAGFSWSSNSRHLAYAQDQQLNNPLLPKEGLPRAQMQHCVASNNSPIQWQKNGLCGQLSLSSQECKQMVSKVNENISYFVLSCLAAYFAYQSILPTALYAIKQTEHFHAEMEIQM